MLVDPLGDYPGYTLRRASAGAIQRLARRLESLELRVSEASVLLVIEANPNTTQSEIGRLLDIAGANMAPLMRGLDERKLIDRSPVDGRSHALRLTDSGRTLSQKARKIFKAHEEELVLKIPAADRGAFLRALRALHSALNE